MKTINFESDTKTIELESGTKTITMELDLGTILQAIPTARGLPSTEVQLVLQQCGDSARQVEMIENGSAYQIYLRKRGVPVKVENVNSLAEAMCAYQKLQRGN